MSDHNSKEPNNNGELTNKENNDTLRVDISESIRFKISKKVE
jgi:hypothetical protein